MICLLEYLVDCWLVQLVLQQLGICVNTAYMMVLAREENDEILAGRGCFRYTGESQTLVATWIYKRAG